jgi:hypothetical protein
MTQEGLAALVEELHREIEGLHRRHRTRALIEQAKGILVERHRITPARAFEALRTTSQRENARLVDVAATIIAAVSPGAELDVPVPEEVARPPLTPGTSTAWRTLRDWPGVRAAAVDAIVASVASAAEHGDDAAHLLAELSTVDPDGVLICALRDDSSLEVVGSWGYPPAVMSAWRRIPLSLDIPLTRAAGTGHPLLIADVAAMEEGFPATKGTHEGFGAWAVVPVQDQGRLVGVLGLSWHEPPGPSGEEFARCVRRLERPGGLLAANLGRRDPDHALLSDLLRLNPDPWLVLAIAPGADLAAQHLIIEAASPELAALRGARLLVAFPQLAAERELLADLLRTMRDHGVLLRTVTTPGPTGAPWDQGPGELRAVRSGGRLVLTWRAVAEVLPDPAEEVWAADRAG